MHPLETEIITHMARTLFVSKYADAYDEGDLHRMVSKHLGYTVSQDPDEPEPNWQWDLNSRTTMEIASSEDYFDSEEATWEAACEHAGVDIPFASMGSDWMDAAPDETPVECLLICAREVGAWLQSIRDYFKTQGADKYVSLLEFLRQAALADGLLDVEQGHPAADDSDARVAHYHEQLPKLRAGRHEQFTYAESFGHNLAMMWMGHGVGWFDDHAKFDLPRWNGLEHEDIYNLGFEPATLVEVRHA